MQPTNNNSRIRIDIVLLLSSLAYIAAQQQFHSGFHIGDHHQIATSVLNSDNNSDSISSQQVDSISNLYPQHQKFRVNVSNVCEKSQMRVTVRLSKPFYGLIHAKDKRKKSACFVEGTGDQTYTMDISYTLVQSEANYCGVVSYHSNHQRNSNQSVSSLQQQQQQQLQHQTLSVVLVVRLHKTIEFSDDRYFLLSCANRCSRSDCSPTYNESSRQGGQQTFRGLTSSESAISPVLRQTVDPPSKFVDTLTIERESNYIGPRFQWLVKLCWLLSGLLMLMFAVNFYLCFALSRSRIKSRAKLRNHGRSKRPPQIASTSQSGQSDNSTWSTSALSSGDVDKVRKDNVFTVKQYQQQAMNGLLNTNAIFNSEDSQHQEPLLGRSGQNTARRQRQFDAGIRRRRSIGSTAALENETMQTFEPILNGKMNMSQRAKSRSQTTIHYDQSQDPFKTVPFNYINNGYLSDDANSRQMYATNLEPLEMPRQQNMLTIQPNSYLEINQGEHMMQPMLNNATTQSLQQQHRIELTDLPRWSTFKPAAPMPDSQQLRNSCSQFDPQNSSHLIDLIKLKHQQQLAQAYRTAASMKSNDLQDLQSQGINVQEVTSGNWR